MCIVLFGYYSVFAFVVCYFLDVCYGCVLVVDCSLDLLLLGWGFCVLVTICCLSYVVALISVCFNLLLGYFVDVGLIGLHWLIGLVLGCLLGVAWRQLLAFACCHLLRFVDMFNCGGYASLF